ncbi:MAG: gamma-glutamyl-phosphate reductase, partial [Caldilinea sp.]|nr:gamma-glutamyl-phosphate reductase [Caldilinea sp.]
MVMVADQTTDLVAMGQAARAASRRLASYTTNAKNAALMKIADVLEAHVATIVAANEQDMADGRAKGLTPAMLDRLML